jgi:hypothetical protein
VLDIATIAVGVGSLVLGWLLKTATDRWTWRRQLVLDAYIEFLDAVDRYSIQVSQVFAQGTDMEKRTAEWLTLAEEARQGIAAVDRVHGKLSLVSKWRGAMVAGDLYVACEAMYRRAIVVPPSSSDHFQESSIEMVKIFNRVVDEARSELHLRHWRERIPFSVSRFELMTRRLARLDETDPIPGKKQEVHSPVTSSRPPGLESHEQLMDRIRRGPTGR